MATAKGSGKRQQRKYRIDRRSGKNVWGRAKSPVARNRQHPPGQHGGKGHQKGSDYGTQLRAKQLLKGYYGNMTEKQFASTYKEAVRLKGDTSENLVGLLERRLDVVVYRANFVPTIFAARQLVSHKHVKVNGQKVNIPSYKVRPGDVVELCESSRQIPMILEAIQTMERNIPDYMTFEPKECRVSLTRVPKFADIPYPVEMEPHLVVEFYSR
ncbi:MAG: rpsD [Rickettsiales bacterium]|jgi:small subunit ribosomal protein S4|nr:rpsD [Rickettsiales bacterium]